MAREQKRSQAQQMMHKEVLKKKIRLMKHVLCMIICVGYIKVL